MILQTNIVNKNLENISLNQIILTFKAKSGV